MICPQCGREMEPCTIPFRWECNNHPMRLYVQEPEPLRVEDMGIADYAVIESRRQARWDAQIHHIRTRVPRPAFVPAPECPSCHMPMIYNPTMNQWECTRYLPPFILTAEELIQGRAPTTRPLQVMDQPMTATDVRASTLTSHIQIDMAAFMATNPVLTPPSMPWFSLDSLEPSVPDPERIARRKQQELEAEYRESTTSWFNDMPKALKILYISTNKESEDMMEHFRAQDPRKLTFRSLYGSCQSMLIQTYMKQHPKKVEQEVAF